MYYVHYVGPSDTRKVYLVDETSARYSIKSFAGPFRSLEDVEDFIQHDASSDDIIEVWEFGG